MSGTQQPPGMQRIPMATESADLDSPSGSLEQLVNYYVEREPDQAKSTVEIKSTPGLVNVYTLGVGPIVAMNSDLPGRLYIVSGANLWRVTDSDTTNMGSIGNTAYMPPPAITIATGPSQMVVCVPPNAFAASVSETVVHPITGTSNSPFPGASSVAYLEGYFVFTAASNTSQFFCTALFDPNTIDALDFAFADQTPNVVRRVITHLQRLWFLGESSIEVWYLSGDADFPFRPDAGGVIPYGVMSPRSAVICDGSIFWLGVNGIVFRTDGYAAVRVSTHAIEKRIAQYFAGSGVPGNFVMSAVSFVDDGHVFYALNLQKPGDLGMTVVYDCATKRWHYRSSTPDNSARWRVNAAALAGNLLLGDYATGKIFTFSDSAPNDDDAAVVHTAVFPPLWNGTNRAFMARLEVETDVGGSAINLDWTDDAGATWKGGRTLSTAGKRAYTTRLGSFRERTIRLSTTGKSRIHGVDVLIESGNA